MHIKWEKTQVFQGSIGILLQVGPNIPFHIILNKRNKAHEHRERALRHTVQYIFPKSPNIHLHCQMTREWRGGEMRGWLKQNSDLSSDWVWCHSHTGECKGVNLLPGARQRPWENVPAWQKWKGKMGKMRERFKENHVHFFERFLKLQDKHLIVYIMPFCVCIFFELQCFQGCPSLAVLDISWRILTYWVSLPH